MHSDTKQALKNLTSEVFDGDSSNLALLVGAGVSIDGPSHLIDGGSFSRSVLRHVCPTDIDREWLLSTIAYPQQRLYRPGEYLRFEMMMSALVQSGLDRELKVLSCLRASTEPNINHFFLAAMIGAGAVVMTTNFDQLIELAFERLTDGQQLRVICSDADFPDEGPAEKSRILWKLHGTLEERSSLGATVTSIMARQMTLHKRRFLERVLRSRDLVVVGYSGSDDLDLTPVLAETKSSKRLVWTQHCRDACQFELQVDDACIERCSAATDRDIVGRTRVLFLASRGKIREQGKTVLLTAPTSEWLRILFDHFCPNTRLPSEITSVDVKNDFFGGWSADLPKVPSRQYDFVTYVFSNRRFRADVADKLKFIESRSRDARADLSAPPEEQLQWLISNYNDRGGADNSLTRITKLQQLRSRVGDLSRILPPEHNGTAMRLSACIDWEVHGAHAGAVAFRRAADIDREIGNDWHEFQTLHTWSSFAGVDQWCDIFPEFESEAVRNLVPEAQLEKLRNEARELGRLVAPSEADLFPDDACRRKVDLAHRTGQLPLLWSPWIHYAVAIGVDCEPPMGLIWEDRLQRLIRFTVDMGDVAGEAQTTLCMARLRDGLGQHDELIRELLRVKELGRIVPDGRLVSEAMMALSSRRPPSEMIDSIAAELQTSMWGRELGKEGI